MWDWAVSYTQETQASRPLMVTTQAAAAPEGESDNHLGFTLKGSRAQGRRAPLKGLCCLHSYYLDLVQAEP